MILNVTRAEMRMLFDLLHDNKRTGEYYGNRKEWERRREVLIAKMKEQGMGLFDQKAQ